MKSMPWYKISLTICDKNDTTVITKWHFWMETRKEQKKHFKSRRWKFGNKMKFFYHIGSFECILQMNLYRSPFMFLQILFVGKLLKNVYAVDFWLYIPYSSCVIKASSNRKERFYYRIYLFSEMLRSLENILITLKAGSLALHLYSKHMVTRYVRKFGQVCTCTTEHLRYQL